jgi:tetratricopeptide (TPR) repeat protein
VNRPKTISPDRSKPARRRGWLIALAALVGLVALGAAAVPFWRSSRLVARVQTGLPAIPDLKGKPALQAELLAKAQARTKSSGTAFDGVTELGRLYHANGYRSEAEACWRLLLREQPTEAKWAYYLADLRRAASDYPEMSALLEQTVKLAPDYSPAWLQLANLQFKTGHLDVAARYYQKRLTLLPNDPYANLGLARIALQDGRRDEARRLVEQLIHDVPGFSTGHNLYAEMLAAAGDAAGVRRERWLGRETGRFRDAEDPWLDGLSAWCYDFGRLCVLGTIEFQVERSDRGKSLIERAIQLEPDNPVGYELLGGLYSKLGNPAKARETFEQGLQRAKSVKPSPMYYVNLSETYRTLKQPAEALRVIQLGIAQAGNELELYDALGVACADLNRQEDAVAAFRQVLARNPNDSNSNYNLGMSLLALGRQDEAYAAFQRSLVLQPTMMKALSLLGRWNLEAGRLDAAEGYLQPLYESHPEMPEARQMLAQWHLRSGAAAETKTNFAAAEQHYKEGAALDPNRVELSASLGVLYLIQGRLEEAREPLENYHRLAPNDPQSALFLGQVYLRLNRFEEARKVLVDGLQLAERTGNKTTAAHFREILEAR